MNVDTKYDCPAMRALVDLESKFPAMAGSVLLAAQYLRRVRDLQGAEYSYPDVCLDDDDWGQTAVELGWYSSRAIVRAGFIDGCRAEIIQSGPGDDKFDWHRVSGIQDVLGLAHIPDAV